MKIKRYQNSFGRSNKSNFSPQIQDKLIYLPQKYGRSTKEKTIKSKITILLLEGLKPSDRLSRKSTNKKIWPSNQLQSVTQMKVMTPRLLKISTGCMYTCSPEQSLFRFGSCIIIDHVCHQIKSNDALIVKC